MEFPDKTLWRPDADAIASARITELCQRLRVPSVDALYRLSIDRPEAYWDEVIRHLGFDFLIPYARFCDESRGPELPSWFVGGRLNWASNVLKWSMRPQARAATAVVSEREDGGIEELSYAELSMRVMRFAGGLKELGIGRGDRVGLMMPMGASAVISFIAIAAVGAICVPLFTGFGADAVVARLQLAGVRALIAADGCSRRGRIVSLMPVLRETCARMGGLRLVLERRNAGLDASALLKATGWGAVAAAVPADRVEPMSPDEPFMLMFTSGTTGRPKGTVHTHGGFPLKIMHDCAYHFNIDTGSSWLWPSDMGWIVGPLTTVGALSLGARLVCYDGAPDFPTAARFASLIDRHSVTHFGASPTLLRSLAAAGRAVAPEQSTLQLLVTAGEVIDPEHFEWFFRTFGRSRLPVINYTGGTEASGAILANLPVRPIKVSGFNSVSPGVAAYAAGPGGGRVQGEVGELTIARPFVGMTRSFWLDHERYLESYWAQVPGVWTHGDLVHEDADGHFFVLGRSDDTLKIAGKRVGPAEVEAIVLEVPGVREAAAVGLADPVKGQALVICVVPSGEGEGGGGAWLEREVAARLEHAMGKPFRPQRVHCVEDLPRTRNGKIMRRVIRRVLGGEEPGDLTSLENPESIALVRDCASRT